MVNNLPLPYRRYMCQNRGFKKSVYTLNPFCEPYCTEIHTFYNISTLQKAYPSIKPQKKYKTIFFYQKTKFWSIFLQNLIENILSRFKF